MVTPTATGSLSNTASVTAAEADPYTANNSATASNTVNAIVCAASFVPSSGDYGTAANWSTNAVPGGSTDLAA